MADGAASRGWALVTGASSGLGVEFARQLAAKGWDVVLVARRRDRLEVLAKELAAKRAGCEAVVLDADLGAPGGAREVLEELDVRGIAVDVLVNNAGFGQHGLAVDLPVDRALAMIDLNVRALTELALTLATKMAGRGRGFVVNVASTGAFQPDPYFAVYGATKAYVLSFSEALAQEVAARGVSVTCCCPGPTQTEFFEAGGVNVHLTDAVKMSAERCVRITLRGMERRKRVVITGWMNVLSALLSKFSPRWAVVRVAGWLMRPKLKA